MNKFSSLLDDITVINFPMLWKLVLRYRSMCIGVTLVIILISVSFYFFQSNIFSSSISFKAVRTESSSQKIQLFNQDDNLLKADIMRLARSVDFYRLIAGRLLVDYSLEEVLKGMVKNSRSQIERIQLECSDHIDCSTEQLANLIPPSVDIAYGDRDGNNFVLTVRTVNSLFNRKLLDTVVEAINSSRIESRRIYLIEQQQITKQMIEKNRTKLASLNYQEMSRQLGQLASQEKEIEDKLKTSHQNLLGQMERFDAAKSQLENRRQAKDSAVSLDDVEISKRRRSLQAKVEQLTGDINAVELMADSQSAESTRILRELKAQLAQSKDELSRMPQESRRYDNTDKFNNSNDELIDASEFNFKVMQDQLEMAKSKHQKLQVDKEQLIDHKIKLETQIKQIAPTVSLLNDLESKSVEYQLLESTVVSDLVFDRFATSVKQMRKIPLFLLGLYSFIALFFSVLVALIARYLMDHRIYDEDDLRSVLSHVKILGSIPEF